MLTWDEYRSRFEPFIRDGRYNASSIKTFRNVFSRLTRHLYVEDLFDPARLLRYRRQLPTTVVGNVDAVLRFLRELDDAPQVPLPIRRPLLSCPHPLFADLMHVGSVFGNQRMTEMTWSDAAKYSDGEEATSAALWRVWTWQMGTDSTPTPESPLVPVSCQGMAIREWEVDAIINSAVEKERKGGYGANPAFKPMVTAIESLTVAQATAEILRDVCTAMGCLGKHGLKYEWGGFYRLAEHVAKVKDPMGLWYWAKGLPADKAVNPDLLW